ncbi:MAG: PH domain-containing protein [Chloroflexota bacterium]|nr:PH domain-containing protein [Chloroflexota bacterium]
MRYADTLLAGGEVVLRRARQHWIALLLGSRNALLPWAAGIAAFFFGSLVVSPHSDVLADLLGTLAAVLLLAGLALFLIRLWQWWAQDYLITNRRIVKVEGIINKRSADSSLEKITDAILHQDLLARLLGYGDLDIVTAADAAIDRYRMLDRAPEFKREMLNAKHSFEMEMSYRPPPGPPIHSPPRPQPGPARRAQEASPSPSRGTPASPAAAPPSRPPGSATPIEILDVLARLADLRDRGAITPAEYETKKAELLARL